MPKIPGGFNASQWGNMNNTAPIPANEYLLAIENSDVVWTEAAKAANDPKAGQMIKLTFRVLEGEYKGRKVYENINIVHPNPKTVEIAREHLATLSRACGLGNDVPDTDMLHNIPVKATVTIQQPKDKKRAPRNKITFYESAEGYSTVGSASEDTATIDAISQQVTSPPPAQQPVPPAESAQAPAPEPAPTPQPAQINQVSTVKQHRKVDPWGK